MWRACDSSLQTYRCIQTYSRLIVPFNYFVSIWSERKFHRNSCALILFHFYVVKNLYNFISNYCGTQNKTCIQEYTNIFFIPHIVYFSHKNCLPELWLYISFHWSGVANKIHKKKLTLYLHKMKMHIISKYLVFCAILRSFL